MTKLTLAFAMMLTAAAAANAQTTPAGTPWPPNTLPIEGNTKKIQDPVILEERHIAASRNSTAPAERRASTLPDRDVFFKAEIKVKNSSAKAIRYVTWTATLLDSETGEFIRSYYVTTEAKIAPGKTRKLSERLLTPIDRVVRANARRPDKPNVADIKVKVNEVTYADGTTSTTP